VAYLPPDDLVEPWEPNVTALQDPAGLKWKDLVPPGVPLPTPWPKAEFDSATREAQARRAALRQADRPEADIDALFREQQVHDTALLGRGPYAGQVGAFEGANYLERGYYRPSQDCIMFTRDEVPFCPVCLRAINRVLDLHTTG
jgi:hypothetical protein